jgi:putative copper resistance protein D
LLVAGRPLRLAIMTAARPERRARLQRVAAGPVVTFLTHPVIAVTSYTVVIVGTHLTSLMDVIMRNTWIGQLEKVVYVVVGVQLFVILVGDEPIHWRLSSPVRWLILAVGMAVDTFTGIVIMQGRAAIDMLTVPGVHVNALSDTQTGGAIMWFGGDGIMAAIMVALVFGWIRGIEDRTPDESGWLEQARRTTFQEQTGADAPDSLAATFDEDDAARASYNAWLERLERGG